MLVVNHKSLTWCESVTQRMTLHSVAEIISTKISLIPIDNEILQPVVELGSL